jgi:hypothetical protein
MYPASVVKLFYVAYAAELLERKRLKLTPELERGLRDMIVESSNDATALVLDAVTGTTGGPELPPKALAQWMERRQVVNRWFAAKGYTGVNACQRRGTRDPTAGSAKGTGRSSSCGTPSPRTRASASWRRSRWTRSSPPRWCEWMRGYLRRKVAAEEGADSQSREFTGEALPKGVGLWSKAGYTSQVRHDVAHVRALDGREFVLVIFTKGHSENTKLVPFMAVELLRGLKVVP